MDEGILLISYNLKQSIVNLQKSILKILSSHLILRRALVAMIILQQEQNNLKKQSIEKGIFYQTQRIVIIQKWKFILCRHLPSVNDKYYFFSFD